MDERLLDYYNNELRHLRETAGEFARDFPKIAGRLSLDKDAKEICPDPYVERLLEGFAWLAARVHLKMDAEFPRFTQSLLETVYPHFLSPIPSMAVSRFDPSENDPALAVGVPVPRGALLRGSLGKGDRTACTFQTAHEVRLLPLRIVEARYFTRDIVQLNLPPALQSKAALRLRLQATAGVPFSEIKLDPIAFFLRGADEFPSWIYEQIFARKTALVLQSPEERGKTIAVLPAGTIRQVGFATHQALLPAGGRSFEGYRLLREYFAFPQRFRFFEISGSAGAGNDSGAPVLTGADGLGLADAVKLCKGSQLDLVILLKEADTRLEGRLNATSFELFCTPIINLFSKTLDRIDLSNRFSEFHVVADHNRPLDFEIFDLESVTGYGTEPGQEQEFRPFYLARDAEASAGGFYTGNRVPRVLSEKERQFGRRSTYAGTEVYLSLVDADSAPYRPDLRQLGMRALCTNRHLPIQMAVGVGRTDFTMDINVPITAIRCLAGPTVPLASQAESRFAWRLISHLSLNYLSLTDSTREGGAAGLREVLKLYTHASDRLSARQLEGLLDIQSRPVLRRVKTPGPISFARGLEVSITLDENAFEGIGVFLIGAVLERFLAKYVSLNSFTETVIRTQQRGEIMRWPAQIGKRQIL